MKVPFNALDQQHTAIMHELLEAVSRVIRSGTFIVGGELEHFEKRFAAYHNRQYAIGLNSGTDALILSLRALDIGPGDEVITTGNSFITTVSSIVLVGATPVLIDIADDDNIDANKIVAAITPRTKAILPVHWMGRPAQMDLICSIAQAYNLEIVEDCAQAISATFNHQLIGTFGTCGAFSLHPFKTLGACGDAGVVITDDVAIAERLKRLRHNGLSMQGVCDEWSNNSRLDEMQAAILNVKFNYFEAWTRRRLEIAHYYDEHLGDIFNLVLPKPNDQTYQSVYHTYIIKTPYREELRRYLFEQGIETRIHYGTPIHKQPAMKRMISLPKIEKMSEEIVSLPIYPELTDAQLAYIVESIKSFYVKKSSESLCKYPIHT